MMGRGFCWICHFRMPPQASCLPKCWLDRQRSFQSNLIHNLLNHVGLLSNIFKLFTLTLVFDLSGLYGWWPPQQARSNNPNNRKIAELVQKKGCLICLYLLFSTTQKTAKQIAPSPRVANNKKMSTNKYLYKFRDFFYSLLTIHIHR